MSYECHLDPVSKLRLLTAAAAHPSLSRSSLRLLIALAEYFAGPNGCYPSLRKMEQFLACSRNSVLQAIAQLEAAKFIRVTRSHGGRNKRNRYYFRRVPKTVHPTEPFREDDPEETVQPTEPETVHFSDGNGSVECTRINPYLDIPLNKSLLSSSTKTTPQIEEEKKEASRGMTPEQEAALERFKQVARKTVESMGAKTASVHRRAKRWHA